MCVGVGLLAGCGDVRDAEDGEHVDSQGASLKLNKKYDGETLFRGIFFGTGPVAKAMPELWGTGGKLHPLLAERSKDPAAKVLARVQAGSTWLRKNGGVSQADELDKVLKQLKDTQGHWPVTTATAAHKDSLVSFIKQRDPTFFPRFATESQSGNAARLDATLLEGGKLVIDSLPKSGTIIRPVTGAGSEDLNVNVNVNLNVDVNVNVAVDVNAVLEVNVAVVAVFAVIAAVVVAVAVVPEVGSTAALEQAANVDLLAGRLAFP
jgi:SdpC family antimicrobial peptide